MRISHTIFFFIASLFLAYSCSSDKNPKKEVAEVINENPPIEGFDLKHSDEKAMKVADAVMKKMGGRKNWDDTHILSWNFFGQRMHYWNKQTGDIRIEIPQENTVLLCNINTLEGKASINGIEPKKEDSLDVYMNLAKEMWVNDSYWLFMPFKLKDSGVTLKYLQKKPLENNEYAHALELTFKDVGFTPNNKYIVYVDPYDKLVVRWDFFQDTLMDNPVFSTTWENYQQYGNILLSSVRSADTITNISVMENAPEGLFTEL